ncbi:MAG: iron-sulfur cluster carrier protein ApbC [Deltaproteobacteria bacterium]|nr:iron-sulfur cluster carrier protein ApbC [Deltaproteobacteria bacterium]
MATPTPDQILEALKSVEDPDLHRDIVSLGFVQDLKVEGDKVAFTLQLTTPACPIRDQLKASAEGAVAALEGVATVEVALSATVPSSAGPGTAGAEPVAPGVKNIILVGSGKGGVGKSTVAVNLAVALKQLGASVGLMDADVYGPSVPMMLGVSDAQPTSKDGKHLEPIEVDGLKVMSIGFLVESDQAMIWRGPMLNQAVVQFLRDVRWGELDYLVVDLPPGTGDVQLTIAQQVRAAGSVLVSTPQDVALLDVIRAKGMMDRVQIPVLGLVENMSFFLCSHCNERTEIFDHGGAREAAKKLSVPFLGAIPIQPAVREGGDRGKPVVMADPESEISQTFLQVAREVAHQVSLAAVGETETAAPTLRMSP